MTDLIRHRGPNGTGLWTAANGRASLGHRRLSVIDLATGQQPMADPTSGVVVVFNGEIYNYMELRSRLRESGVQFSTESDTEVLLRLFLHLGPGFVDRLRGMFAFAIYDPRSRELILARDRAGKKPLYYSVVDDVLYFASTFRAVVSGAGLQQGTLDLEALYRYLTHGYIGARTRRIP